MVRAVRKLVLLGSGKEGITQAERVELAMFRGKQSLQIYITPFPKGLIAPQVWRMKPAPASVMPRGRFLDCCGSEALREGKGWSRRSLRVPGEGAEQRGELMQQAELRLCFRDQGGGQAALPPPRLQEAACRQHGAAPCSPCSGPRSESCAHPLQTAPRGLSLI